MGVSPGKFIRRNMAQFVITGGTPLSGSVRLGGAKNASYKLMIASLLTHGQSRLLNLPHIDDVAISSDIIRGLGGQVKEAGERTLFIDTSKLTGFEIPAKFGPASRASSMFIPVLLARFGQASVPLPGGDKIGARPLNWHLEGLQKMGAKVTQPQGKIVVEAQRLTGATYYFPKNSHTGTETLILAAVLAKGKTVIENAALEPEIDDLILFLNNMGSRIRRRETKRIEIEGVKNLHPTIHKIMPDRNEAVSYACAAIATRGDIIVENAKKEHLEAFLDKLDEIGGGHEEGSFGIRFFYQGPLRAADVVTRPHPGFMTDWQPLWTILVTQARGESIVHEAVHSYRFHHVDHLNHMGARIVPFQPAIDSPHQFYNFNLGGHADQEVPHHAIKVSGPSPLRGGTFTVPDLRTGATLVIAALIAQGKTVIKNVEHIDRGYESLDTRLRSMGAKIKRLA